MDIEFTAEKMHKISDKNKILSIPDYIKDEIMREANLGRYYAKIVFSAWRAEEMNQLSSLLSKSGFGVSLNWMLGNFIIVSW